jgi:branched-chain amino acid transport system substrate-binding protein
VKRLGAGFVVTLVATAVVATGCASGDDGSAASGDGAGGGKIPIGVVTDLSGPFVSVGKDVENAVGLAVEEVNAGGGIDGAKLDVTVVDTGARPPQAVTGYRSLVDDGAFAALGPMTSGEAKVLFKQTASLKLPLITGTANEEGLTELGDNWAFRNTATNTELYEVALPAWQKAYSIASAALVFDEEQPTATAAAAAVRGVAAKAGVEIVDAGHPITFSTGETDFSSVVQRIKDARADGLIILTAPTEGGLLARELARQGEKRPVLGNPPQAGASFFEGGGEAIDDWVLPSIFDPARDSPKTKRYVQAMAERDKEPPTIPEAANYYDGVLLLAAAIKQAHVTPDTPPAQARERIRDALLHVSIEGAAGRIAFDGGPDARKPVVVKVVRGGKLEALETA